VWGAVSKLDRREVAIKVIPLAGLKPSTEAGIRREADILRHLHHKNIVKSYDFIDTTTHLNVVLERVDGGELFDRIIKKVTCCVCSNSVVLYLLAVIATTSLVSIFQLETLLQPFAQCISTHNAVVITLHLQKFYNEKEARDLAVVILKAIKHCHDHKVVHRYVVVG
jgi:serine/threonine protein kinase